MKKFLLGAVASIILMSAVAFKVTYDIKNSTAEVEQVKGIYVFVDSKPVKEYEYLGTYKCAWALTSTQYDKLMPIMVDKALKDYPKADAVIFKNGNITSCDAVKFK